MALGICKLCCLRKQLVKAHITPRSLQSEALKNGTAKIYSNKGHEYPRRSPSGIYDTNILCADCDNIRLGRLDHYASELLRHPLAEILLPSCWQTGLRYTIPTVDYNLFKLSVVSLLWRAQLSRDPFFADVQLAEADASELRRMIWERDPGTADHFGVIVSRFFVLPPTDELVAHIPASPALCSGPVCFYVLRGADFRFLVKVDRRAFPANECDRILSPGRPLVVTLENFMDREFHRVAAIDAVWP